MTQEEFRKHFPILSTEVYGKPLVYFDNAATSQRPQCVVDKLVEMNLKYNANTHRAVHKLSADATDEYEKARDAAARYVNAESREQIIFTSGASAALNLMAYSFCEAFVGVGDRIIVGEAEHHSNFVPWQQIALRKGAEVVFLRCNEGGLYEQAELEKLLTGKTRLVCMAHASNVLGIVNPVAEFAAICHKHNVPLLVDGAQGVVHCKVDVQALGCDFYAFSAHKMLGPTGVGVLYGKKTLLEHMPPFMYGGEMVGTVSMQQTDFAPLPLKFEAGTPNFCSVPALTPALEMMAGMLNDEQLTKSSEEVKSWLYEALMKVDGLHLYGGPNAERSGKAIDAQDKLPIFSISIDGVHHEDLAILMDKMGIALRSGQMCAEPLMRHFSVSGMLRISLMPYNTMQEAEYFISCLDRAVKMLR